MRAACAAAFAALSERLLLGHSKEANGGKKENNEEREKGSGEVITSDTSAIFESAGRTMPDAPRAQFLHKQPFGREWPEEG